ncbi:MAG: hypothetical protein NC300_11780 [Bacteroidales bacterium]|nr:hypothetical protein [Clostridium sp.]MCM1204812.1 hypothetical protein [Bacteroidales bacterium]
MFSYEEQLAFLEKYSECNRKVAIEFLGREDGVLFKEPVQQLPEWKVDSEKIYQNLVVFMTEALCFQERKIKNEQEKTKYLKERIYQLEARVQSLEEVVRSPGGLREQITSMYRSLIFRGYRKLRSLFGRK